MRHGKRPITAAPFQDGRPHPPAAIGAVSAARRTGFENQTVLPANPEPSEIRPSENHVSDGLFHNSVRRKCSAAANPAAVTPWPAVSGRCPLFPHAPPAALPRRCGNRATFSRVDRPSEHSDGLCSFGNGV
ncbi:MULTISPECIES: hypothetical protein [unclassified Neisseria]|uniref:hypothetical protein n=1 Tax=unclassified Neisseria TaxID=2623750 RepID=UPI0010726F45|nr:MULTISPECIES: hypothetical protein [unclassified Neisseria]MBF0803150.1 hypothetical protein [Neisseria sp. 19428wB4_WF04]TFU44271.1 hypothetical protein E4T99_02060 [Neisseria sp. WF04]